MLELIKEAKKNSQAIVFENYQIPDITWEDVLLFLYKESLVVNKNLEKK